MIVDLETAKKHLRVTSTDEDTLISLYMAAAEDHIKNYIDGPIGSPFDIPASIKAAQLLLIGDMYENREAQGEALNTNPAVARLLAPYRQNMGV